MEDLPSLKQRKRLLVRGSAGTGKTSMVDALIDEILLKCQRSYSMFSSLHKAWLLLSGKITNNKVIFLLSFWQIQKNTNRSTGEETLHLLLVLNIHQCKDMTLLIREEAFYDKC
jgi:hypothetical protein